MTDGRTITVVSTPSKLVDVVLASDGSNFAEWKFLVKINLVGMGKDGHLTESCPTEPNAEQEWKNDDKALLSRIINCIDRKLILSMQHCDTVKSVWDLVDKWFSGAQNLRKLYQLSQSVYRPSQKGRDIREYYHDFKNMGEALCAAIPITNDEAKMKKQRDQLLAFSWISGLDKEYDILRSQLLGNKELETLDQVFSMVQNASIPNSTDETAERNVFVSQGSNVEDRNFMPQGYGVNENFGRGSGGRSRGRGGFGRGRGGGRGGPRTCYNCGDPGHLRNQCPKPFRQQRFANNAVTKPEGHTVVMTDEELALFNQMKMSSSVQPSSNQESFPSASATFVQTGNPTACVSTSSRQWVIDSGATDHMSGSFDEGDYW